MVAAEEARQRLAEDTSLPLILTTDALGPFDQMWQVLSRSYGSQLYGINAVGDPSLSKRPASQIKREF
ncbi:hypothetical protein Tdes44962_MAKER06519 [Teratosphaeria destructans]|uniref:Uncharacterized protein n=1 Tax=Teratosphaeria destructans TaxID=418781 RepID=A0A9W7W6Z0_9PEZI|nr:hypothetical protein Tdes44962_MAKER06519 [Teratosphaeria destructans]